MKRITACIGILLVLLYGGAEAARNKAEHKTAEFLYGVRSTPAKAGQFLAAFRVEDGGRLRPVPLWVNTSNVPFVDGGGTLVALPAKHVLFMQYQPDHSIDDPSVTNIAQFRILPNGKLRYEKTYGLGHGWGGLTFHPSGKFAYVHVDYQGDLQAQLPAPQQGRLLTVRVTPRGDLLLPGLKPQGRVPLQITACGSYTTQTRIAPAGNLLCTGDTEGFTRLYAISRTGLLSSRPVGVFGSATRRAVPVSDIAIMPDGKHIYAQIYLKQIVQLRKTARGWTLATPPVQPLPNIAEAMTPTGPSTLLARPGVTLTAFRVMPTGGLQAAAVVLSPAYNDTQWVIDAPRRRAYVTFQDTQKHMVIGLCKVGKDGVPHPPFVPVVHDIGQLYDLTLVEF